MDKIYHNHFDIPLAYLKVDDTCIKKSKEILDRNQEEFLNNPEPDDKMMRTLKKIKSM